MVIRCWKSPRRDPLSFQVWNADGSKATMCGNGARAIMRLAEAQAWIQGATPNKIFTLSISGRECSAKRLADEGDYEIGLGPARVEGINRTIIDNQSIPFFRVDVGNPHVVIFCGKQSNEWHVPVDFTLKEWGPKLSKYFSANVELVHSLNAGADAKTDPKLDVLAWELGAGPTLACGSGGGSGGGCLCPRGHHQGQNSTGHNGGRRTPGSLSRGRGVFVRTIVGSGQWQL